MAQITEIRIGNFGPFGSVQVIPCKPLTLIYGPNNVGKSTILRALLTARRLDQHGFGDRFEDGMHGLLTGGYRKRWQDPIDPSPWLTEFGHFGLSVRGLIRKAKGREEVLSIGWEVATDDPSMESVSGERVLLSALLVESQPAVLFREDGVEQYAADHPVFAGLKDDGLIPRGTIAGIRESMQGTYPPDWYDWKEVRKEYRGIMWSRRTIRESIGDDPRPRRYRKGRLPKVPKVKPYLGAQADPLFPTVGREIPPAVQADRAQFLQYIERSMANTGTISALVDELGATASMSAGACLSALRFDVAPARAVPQGTVAEFHGGNPDHAPRRALEDPRMRAWIGRLGFAVKEQVWSRDDGGPGKYVRWEITDLRTSATGGFEMFGDGLGQLFPVLESFTKEGIVFVKQPELHLHPALQAELGDILLEATGSGMNDDARESANLSQLLVETHSEHILLRLMRRMRETVEGRASEGAPRVTPDDVGVLYVEPRGSDSIVHELPLTERGELVKPWPGGFFEEGLREVFS